jgi:hypothetical protein
MKWKNLVFQFQVALKEINPFIWRRIQVPATYSFWDFHVAIQDSMGWFDCHLHMFRLKKPRGKKLINIGIPMDEFDDIKVLPGWDIPLTNYLVEPGHTVEYEYDFGDGWDHLITFEGILMKEKMVKYPICMEGERACPPEDCGGVPGYERFVNIIMDPSDEEYKAMCEWVSGWYGEYDPERFDPKKVKFDNPKTRWKKAFQSSGI